MSHNTAWSLKHKLTQVMKERDDTRPLGGWVQFDDAYWGRERRAGSPLCGSQARADEVHRERRRSSLPWESIARAGR